MPSVHADQSDPALDGLFWRLATSDGAEQSAQALRTINQIWIEHDDSRVRQLMLVGTQMLNAGALDQAAEVFGAVTVLAPDYAEGWNRLATVLFYQGLNVQALEPTHRTLALEPRHYGALVGLAMIYERLGRNALARRYFLLAYALNPAMSGPLERAKALDHPADTQGLFLPR